VGIDSKRRKAQKIFAKRKATYEKKKFCSAQEKTPQSKGDWGG